jgi:hypothetical protein
MQSIYIFQGHKFAEYADISLFKDRVQKELGYSNPDADLSDFYKDFLDNHLDQRKKFDKIFFENIFYGQLKNVFLHQLAYNYQFTTNEFEQCAKELIEDFNMNKQFTGLEQIMSPKGFYLMDNISISQLGSTFICGYDYEERNNIVTNARFLIVHTVPKKNGSDSRYFLCGVELNFDLQVCVIKFRNITSEIPNETEFSEFTDEVEWFKSINDFYYFTKRKIFNCFNLQENFNPEQDRKKMYELCKKLDDILLEEFREELERKTGSSVEDFVGRIFNTIFPSSIKPPEKEIIQFKKRMEALLLSTYINTLVDDEGLVDIAKEKKLIGFPTKISFVSSNAAKGSTGTASKDSPLSGVGMFHSLYADFEDSLNLPNWSMSWFVDYEHNDPSNIELIPTSIVSTTKYFKIIFLNRKHLTREQLYNVVNYISRIRQG